MKLSKLKALHDQGLALIYLHPKQKRPLENKWTSGPRKTWTELKREFNPSYNVGVRLGEPSRVGDGYLCCIDVDIKDPAYKNVALKKLKEVVGDVSLYPTVVSGSGNGSCHLYAWSNEPFAQTEIEKHKGLWEIVVYSTGRQMVLPPSIHPSGAKYTWTAEGGLSEIPPLPDGIRISGKSRTEKSSGDFKAVDVNLYDTRIPIYIIKMIEEGEGCEDRSAALLSIAMSLCHAGLDDNQILSVLSHPDHWISEAAYDHTQSQSRDRAVKWLRTYTLEKARYNTSILRRFENKPKLVRLSKEEAAQVSDEVVLESNETLPDKAGNGKAKSTLRNLVHILEHFMGGGLVGFNEFSNRPFFLKDTPYGGKKDRELVDQNDLELAYYVACHYGFEPSQNLCLQAHTLVAHKHRWHPVRAYLESLVWDGVPRLDSWLLEAFRASGPKDYLNAVGRKVLCAAVTRVMEPGCKFDYVLVLEGNQGEGKSMSLEILATQPWFTDGLGDIHNKDVVDQITGKWVVELSELASIRGKENEHVKSFLSRQVDRVRMSYGKRSQDYPRQSIFIGSTNSSEYFTDETGNRRYWPIKVGTANRKWLRDNREQLWAEAVVRYQLGEKLYLSKELESLAKEEQEKRFEVDEWETEIKTLLLKTPEEGHYRTTDLWRGINLNSGNGHPSTAESKRIGRIMRRLGFMNKPKRLADGVLGKCWVKNPMLPDVTQCYL